MQAKKLILGLTTALFAGIYSSYAQIPDPGFETWANDTATSSEEPVGWDTDNNVLPGVLTVEKYTPPYQGTYSMRVHTGSAGIFNVAGVAYSEFPYITRSASLTGYYKGVLMPGDSMLISVYMAQGGVVIGSGIMNMTSVGGFTVFSIPITYTSGGNPDSSVITVRAGSWMAAQLGTEIIVDALAFSGLSGIEDGTNEFLFSPLFPNPTYRSVNIPLTLTHSSNVSIKVFDGIGREIKTVLNEFKPAGKFLIELPAIDLAEGVYFISISDDRYTHVQKFIVLK